ncbi:hypothetical protein ACHAXT_012308 [Thalassiosira profunda]
MDQQSSSDDAWRVFDRDTEAGRLLSRLYGVSPAGRVSYPAKPQRRRRVNNASSDEAGATQQARWKTTHTVHGWSKEAEEEKERERKENISRALSLAVPKVGRSEQRHTGPSFGSGAKISNVPRRKSALTCRNTIEEAAQKNRHYRPPNSTNLAAEKERYALAISNTKKPSHKARPSPKPEAPIRPSTLFDQIYQEILDRRQHQLAMEEMGEGDATRQVTANEIAQRLEQLKRIDAIRALQVVQKLMKSDGNPRS